MKYPATDIRCHLFVGRELHEAGLSSAAFRVLAALRYHSGRKEVCYPSIRGLAESCRLNKDTVLRSIEELKTGGWLEVESTARRRNVYRLYVPSFRTDSGTSVRVETPICPLNSDRTVLKKGTEGRTVLEGGGTPPPKKDSEGAQKTESNTDWRARLQAAWPGVDIDREIAKADRRQRRRGEDLDRKFFEDSWLPNCSPLVDCSQSIQPPLRVLPSPPVDGERQPNFFTPKLAALSGGNSAES